MLGKRVAGRLSLLGSHSNYRASTAAAEALRGDGMSSGFPFMTFRLMLLSLIDKPYHPRWVVIIIRCQRQPCSLTLIKHEQEHGLDNVYNFLASTAVYYQRSIMIFICDFVFTIFIIKNN